MSYAFRILLNLSPLSSTLPSLLLSGWCFLAISRNALLICEKSSGQCEAFEESGKSDTRHQCHCYSWNHTTNGPSSAFWRE
eukprot:166520-Rhodomonas_salina.2